MYQLRQVFKARLEPAPQSNGVVRFFCDPTFWAKNVVNLGERNFYQLIHNGKQKPLQYSSQATTTAVVTI